ncbi:MAG: hypothetical protein WC886_08840, partial [Saccharofermentanaceae bacterium]|jgi:putative exporter of polyketide antibiotics
VIFGFHSFFPSMPVTTLLFFVAVVSCLFALLGIIIGYYYLYKEVKISFFTIFSEGMVFYQNIYSKFLANYKHKKFPV